MKIKKTNNKVLIVAVAIFLFAGALFAGYLFYTNQNSDNTPTRSQSDIDQAEELANNPDNKSLSPNSDQPNTPPSTTTGPSGKQNVPILASTNTSGDIIYIRGGLSYPVVEDGSCYAQLSGPNGASVRKDTEVLQNPASTDCKTVSLQTKELAKGAWKATLNYSSANHEGKSNEVEFTVN